MTRGEQEQQCFDIVRDKLEKYQYSSTLSEKELNAIRYIFQTSIPNPNSSEFPDFIFENGFIEHFEVTSSKETNKGAKVKAAESAFERENENIFEDMQKNPPIFDSPIALATQMREMDCPLCSYGDYVTSFKKNWEHHIHGNRITCQTVQLSITKLARINKFININISYTLQSETLSRSKTANFINTIISTHINMGNIVTT